MLKSMLSAAAIAITVVALAAPTRAEVPYLRPLRRAQVYHWHAGYAHTSYGQPVALVVPPTAQLQTNWGWGPASSRISRIDHQFGRDYPGPGPFAVGFRQTPHWPRDTAQFGVYHVRGPWYPTQP